MHICVCVFVFHIYKTLSYIIVLLFQQVYICGGFNGVEYHQTCEYYNPETDQWTEIEPMSIQRSGIGIIAYAHHIYAVSVFRGFLGLKGYVLGYVLTVPRTVRSLVETNLRCCWHLPI